MTVGCPGGMTVKDVMTEERIAGKSKYYNFNAAVAIIATAAFLFVYVAGYSSGF